MELKKAFGNIELQELCEFSPFEQIVYFGQFIKNYRNM
jgi:hypothetical protein